MNWLVVTQPKTEDPDYVAEVRTFVVRCETENGVKLLIERHQAGQMIRGMIKLPGMAKET